MSINDKILYQLIRILCSVPPLDFEVCITKKLIQLALLHNKTNNQPAYFTPLYWLVVWPSNILLRCWLLIYESNIMVRVLGQSNVTSVSVSIGRRTISNLLSIFMAYTFLVVLCRTCGQQLDKLNNKNSRHHYHYHHHHYVHTRHFYMYAHTYLYTCMHRPIYTHVCCLRRCAWSPPTYDSACSYLGVVSS